MSDPVQVNPDFPFFVTEEEDGSFTFEWDKNHPVTSAFNDWTEQDFIDMLIDAAEKALAKYEAIQ